MSIRLLQTIFIAGVLSPVDGSTLSLSAALEADLVNQGKAVWVAAPELTASELAHASAHARMRPPKGVPVILAQAAVPIIIPPGSGAAGLQWSGTDGTFTVSTALPSYTFPQDAFMYFPAGQIAGSGNSAGWYYAILSGTGGGKVYNNTYVSGSPIDAIPATPTAFSGVTNGAWLTQTTGSLAFGPVATLPGGLLGKNGRLRNTMEMSTTSNGNSKAAQARVGGIAYGAITWTNSVFGRFSPDMHNRNSLSSQIGTNYTGIGTGAFMITAINTAIDQNLDVTLSIAVNTDYHIMESYSIEVFPG